MFARPCFNKATALTLSAFVATLPTYLACIALIFHQFFFFFF